MDNPFDREHPLGDAMNRMYRYIIHTGGHIISIRSDTKSMRSISMDGEHYLISNMDSYTFVIYFNLFDDRLNQYADYLGLRIANMSMDSIIGDRSTVSINFIPYVMPKAQQSPDLVAKWKKIEQEIEHEIYLRELHLTELEIEDAENCVI